MWEMWDEVAILVALCVRNDAIDHITKAIHSFIQADEMLNCYRAILRSQFESA